MRNLMIGLVAIAGLISLESWCLDRERPGTIRPRSDRQVPCLVDGGNDGHCARHGHHQTTTHRFFGEKEYNMEVRRLVGPQPILQHAKKSDFMVIQDGEGTYMSGGELVNGKAGGEDAGDMRGESIRGGVSRVLKTGDVIFVPAGIPHAFVDIKDHVTFIMVRFDTK